MKKNNRRKRKRLIILITLLFVLLFLAIFYFGKDKNDNLGDNNQIEEPKDKDNENPKHEDKLTDIIITPESYTAYSGEVIDLSKIKAEALFNSGKKEDISNIIEFTTSSGELLQHEGDKLIISNKAITGDKIQLNAKYKGVSKDFVINIFNPIQDNIDVNGLVTNTDAYDVVVNKKRNLPSNYVPSDLVKLEDVPTVLQNPEINQLRKMAYEALKELFTAAKEEESYDLYARSGYRSYNTQNDLYNSYVVNHGKEAADKFSAKPGQSEHQTGLAIDITSESMNFQLSETFGDTEEGKWVAENAYRFGFIIRYPKGKENVTGYMYEPWHLRYLGKDLAKSVYESGLTLEEFYEQ